MKTLYLVDASPDVFRAYYSLPSTITDHEGRPTNAVYGFAGFLCQLLEQVRPQYIAVAFDDSLTTSFRNEIYPPYKAQRELPPPELEAQFDACMQMTRAMGLPTLVSERYEADDLIGTLCVRMRPCGFRMVIVSNDKDLTQLLRDGDLLWDYARDRRLDTRGVREHFGVAPEQVVDLLALMGDKVDNIPGVPGIGRQTAATLLAIYGDLTTLLDRLDDLPQQNLRGAARLQQKLSEYREQALISQRLARIATEVPLTLQETDLQWRAPDMTALEGLFDELNFGTGIRERMKALFRSS